MIVVVSDVSAFHPQGSVTTAQGLSEDGSQIITFAGDWRMMDGLREAVEEEGEIAAYVEGWQVFRSLPNPSHPSP